MLSRRLPSTIRPLARAMRPATRTTITPIQARFASQSEVEDPNMNGGYINPPRIKRQFRDPYGDWWDKQERRNYGEPLHEDNDILGIFSPEQYTHFSSGYALVLLGTFVATVFGLCAVIYPFYPDVPAIPRHYEGGLDRELGGAKAVPTYSTEEEALAILGKAPEEEEEE